MPFGAGPRVCVGGTFAMMEMVAGLATMLRRVSFSPNTRTMCQPVQRITLRPKNGLQIDVSPA
jgi:cytochrome P450